MVESAVNMASSLCDEGLVSAVKADHARHVLLDAEGILPGVGLGVFVADQCDGDKGLAPGAVGFAAAEETHGAVEEVPVVGRTLIEQLGILLVAQRLGHAGQAPVVEGVFDGARSRCSALRGGHVAQFLVAVPTRCGPASPCPASPDMPLRRRTRGTL